jgi:hypothetical protein
VDSINARTLSDRTTDQSSVGDASTHACLQCLHSEVGNALWQRLLQFEFCNRLLQNANVSGCRQCPNRRRKQPRAYSQQEQNFRVWSYNVSRV